MEPCIPLPLDQDVLDDIVDKAKDWALLHGMKMLTKLQFQNQRSYFTNMGESNCFS